MNGTIRIVIFDIDGVLTNGMIYVNENGQEVKAFRLTELDALNEIKRDGFRIIAITGEKTRIVDFFENRIEWDLFIKGCKEKDKEIEKICKRFCVSKEQICYIGDGIYDISAIESVGLGVCPSNAIQEVKEIADVVLKGSGGDGCINELHRFLAKMK